MFPEALQIWRLEPTNATDGNDNHVGVTEMKFLDIS
jgi:hypothetical protein